MPTPRTPLAWLLFPLIVGYLLADLLPPSLLSLALAGFGLAGASIVLAHRAARKTFWIWAVVTTLGGILLSGSFYQYRMAPPQDWNDLPPREAELSVEIRKLYAPGTWNRQRGIGTVRAAPSHLQDLIGQKVHLNGPKDSPAEWQFGSRLYLTGVLKRISPERAAESPFLQSLVRSGVYFQMNQIVEREEADDPGPILLFFGTANGKLETILRHGASTHHSLANIYVAMLLGKKAALSDDQLQPFLLTGTLHLFAISGLHIGVIAAALNTLLLLVRIPRKPRTIIGLTLLLVFVGIAGASPSAVRAFLMVFCFWSARFFGRSSNPVAALANSALLVLLLFPDQLWSPGFQLSYTVVFGILTLGLPLAAKFQERWVPYRDIPETTQNPLQRGNVWLSRNLLLAGGVSLSATLLSSPLSIHYFGIFAPGAVFFNLLLMPAASLVIVAGFISVFAGLLGLSFLSLVFNHAAWLILAGMEAVVVWAAPIPGLFWHGQFVSSVLGGVALLAVIVSILICAQQRWRAPAFHFVIPFAVFILFLLAAGRLTFPGG